MQSQQHPANPPAPTTLLGVGLPAVAHLTNDAVTSMLPALLPLLALRFDLEPSDIAILVSAFAISTSLPQPFFGWFADRVGRHRVAALGLVTSGAFIVTLAWLPSASWLLTLLLLGGLGSSALHPAGMGLARAALTRNAGLAVAIYAAAGMAGGASGPLLAIGVTSGWGFEHIAWAAVPVLAVAAVLGRLAARARTAVVTPQPPAKTGLGSLRGQVAWLALVALGANLVMLTFTSAVPLWLVRERGVEETSPLIAVTLATFSMASAGGGILGGVLVRWLSPRTLIVGSLALSALALQAVFFANPGSAAYVTAVATAGGLLYLSGPLLIARAQELTPGAESAVAGIFLGGTSAAAGLVYGALGAAQTAFGIGDTARFLFLMALPAAHLAAVVLRSPAAIKAPVTCPRGDCCSALAHAA